MSPASPAFSGTVSITGGAETGSGNDAASFQVAGGQVESDSAGGTIQPGQYQITVQASGTYINSPQAQSFTVQATGPGGAGWQLGFSDEFNGAMLQRSVIQTPISITWSSAAGGTATVVLPAASSLSAVNQLVSILGATNSGSGGSALVNGNFLLNGITDSQHFTLYMPATSGAIGTIAGSIHLGTGPWTTVINTSCSSGPCGGLPLLYSNDVGDQEYWNPQNCIETGAGLEIKLDDVGWTAPDGTSRSYAACHIQAGISGVSYSQLPETYFDYDAQVPYGKGAHCTPWALGTNDVWPGGGELDIGESWGNTDAPTIVRLNSFSSSGTYTGTYTIPSGDFSQAFNQFGADWSNSGVLFYVNGTQEADATSDYQTTVPMFPVVDCTIFDSTAGPGDGSLVFPSYFYLKYSRMYQKVGSNACYASIPSPTTVPHTGTC